MKNFLVILTVLSFSFTFAASGYEVSQSELEQCRSLMKDSFYNDVESCWLNVLSDFVIRDRDGLKLTIKLYSNEKIAFHNYDIPKGGCLDPCGPFYAVAGYFPNQDFVVLKYLNEFVWCYQLISMLTGKFVACVKSLSYISSDFQYFVYPSAEIDSGGGTACYYNTFIEVSRLQDVHSDNPKVTQEHYGSLKGRTIVKWKSNNKLLIEKYAYEDVACSEKILSQELILLEAEQ